MPKDTIAHKVTTRRANAPWSWTRLVGAESMGNRMCSIDGCPGKVEARGWCKKHYSRWVRHQDPLWEMPPGRPPVDPALAVDLMRSVGLEPLEPFARSKSPWLCRCMTCGLITSPTYENIKRGQGGCLPSGPEKSSSARSAENHYAYTGDQVSYNAMHRRLRTWRGPASAQLCVDCGERAKDWSYTGGCPKERSDIVDGYVLRYSPDPDMYEPRCGRCHGAYDRKRNEAA